MLVPISVSHSVNLYVGVNWLQSIGSTTYCGCFSTCPGPRNKREYRRTSVKESFVPRTNSGQCWRPRPVKDGPWSLTGNFVQIWSVISMFIKLEWMLPGQMAPYHDKSCWDKCPFYNCLLAKMILENYPSFWSKLGKSTAAILLTLRSWWMVVYAE